MIGLCFQFNRAANNRIKRTGRAPAAYAGRWAAHMKTRRHHNTNGLRQIRSGSSEKRLRRLASQLGIPYGKEKVVGEVLFNYHLYGINGEPEHNTDSILCWCAPTLTPDGVVVHKGLAEIISGAIHRSAPLRANH